MKQLTCEMCGSTEMMKQDGVFVCQACGCKYSVEEAKKMMVEGTVSVQGTVKVDSTDFVEKQIRNARRALGKEDWAEAEKYYNIVEENDPDNIEAVFFSSYGKARLSLSDSDFFKREQIFNVLKKSISVISDYYDTTTENKDEVLKLIDEHIVKLLNATFVFQRQGVSVMGALSAAVGVTGSRVWCANLLNEVKTAFILELKQISAAHDDEIIKELLAKYNPTQVTPNSNSTVQPNTETGNKTEINNAPQTKNENTGGCYVATAVYGSYDCPEVWTLRRFRDYTLAETWYGRAFIRTYYAISPTLVKWFGHTTWFKTLWRGKLDRMVESLNAKGVENTPYKDKLW